MSLESNSDNPAPEPGRLVSHSKRPQWGMAILVEETPERYSFQFQDGQVRSFKPSFIHMMTPVDDPMDVQAPIIADLERLGGRRQAAKSSSSSSKSNSAIVSLDEQRTLFDLLYPEGFGGAKFQVDFRRPTGNAKPRKGHREPAMALAQELLTPDRVDQFLAAEQYGEVHKAACAVLTTTSLVAPKARRALEELSDLNFKAFSTTLRELLFGDGPEGPRFTRFVVACGTAASWPMVTTLLALVDPEKHIPVKASLCREQARWMAPRLAASAQPSSTTYVRVQEMANEIDRRLKTAGHTPRDLLDIYDFMAVTLSPKSRTRIQTAKSAVAVTSDLSFADALKAVPAK